MKKDIIIKIITLKNGSYDKWLNMEMFKGLQNNNTMEELQRLLTKLQKEVINND